MDAEQKEILNLCERWAAAMISNDAGEIGMYMADDWTIIGENGATDKPTFLAWISSGDLTHEAMDLASEPRIVIYGETAILTARVTNHGHYKKQPFAADEWTTDVFRRTENNWLCVLSHITSVK